MHVYVYIHECSCVHVYVYIHECVKENEMNVREKKEKEKMQDSFLRIALHVRHPGGVGDA